VDDVAVDPEDLGQRRGDLVALVRDCPSLTTAVVLDGDRGVEIVRAPVLDDLTMLFFARSLPLKVGDTYSIPRYFIAEGNPVVLRVLRREVITVPAGTFQTVVVQPTIKTSGLFSEGGQAELYFTDDRFHSLIQLKSKVSAIGSLTLRLKKYQRPDVADDPAYALK